jgi:predicted membrane-bound dolichyl-phosphate-mannose-protein mannosyltransferase
MKKWVYLLLLVFFLSKFNLVFRYHDTRWDESVFIGMGKYIFSNGEIGLWEPIRPIGLPLVLGLLWKLGLNPIFSIEFISIFFSVGCIWLVFLIGKNLFNEIIGFLSALILASTPLFYYFSSYGFTGIPSAFFGLLALYFLIKKNIFLTGIFSGIAFLFRFPQGILFAVFGYLVFRKNKDKLFEYCIGIFLSVTPYLIFNLFMYKDMFFPFFEAIPHQTNPVHSVLKGSFLSQAYNLFYYPLVLIKNNPVYLSGIFYFRSKKKILLPFLIFFVYFTAIINKQERFILAFLPYLSLMAGYSLYKLLSKKIRQLRLPY